MEIISSIFNIVIAMGVFGLLAFLVIAAMSKLLNTSAYYRGGKMADPDSLENAFKAIKGKSVDIAQAIKDKSVDLGDMIKQKRKNLDTLLENKKSTKIEKIEKLVELKNDGHINDEEFNYLKSEIMKR